MGHVLYGGEVGRGVSGTDPAFVVAEDHVHHPMQAVLNRPVASYDWPDDGGQHSERGEVEPCFLLDFPLNFAASFHHDDSIQARPVMVFLQPFDIVDNGGCAGLDPAVVTINGGVPADFVSAKPRAFCSVANNSTSSRNVP